MSTVDTKARPILMSGLMVKAILEGRKTQTRRIVKPQPQESFSQDYGPDGEPTKRRCYGWVWVPRDDGPWYSVNHPPILNACPYGKLDDRLWVRETWRCNHIGGMRIEYKAGGACLEFEDWPDDVAPPYIKPDAPSQIKRTTQQLAGEKIPDAWRPSIHMPRWASRLTLRVESVQVERLQEITEEDADREGCHADDFRPDPNTEYASSREVFAALWDKLNANRPGCSWADSPWVWVVSFSKVED